LNFCYVSLYQYHLFYLGWRPKRSILFASWAAEEYGIIGSQEWVEEMGSVLTAQGVALVNTDTCVSGPDLQISASPLLYRMAARSLTKASMRKDFTRQMISW
jgi:Predicted aminopeptidases